MFFLFNEGEKIDGTECNNIQAVILNKETVIYRTRCKKAASRASYRAFPIKIISSHKAGLANL